MTKLQQFIIRNISSMFQSKEDLKEISIEYKKIFKTELKDDYNNWRKQINNIWKKEGVYTK